jgi:hypothetical protein
VSRRNPDGHFDDVQPPDGFIRPRPGVRFDLSGPELVVRRPDGQPLRTYAEKAARGEELARQAANRAAAVTAGSERLRGLLRPAGIDPDAPAGR